MDKKTAESSVALRGKKTVAKRAVRMDKKKFS